MAFSEPLNVHLGTEHQVYPMPKGRYLLLSILIKLAFLSVGILISIKLYQDCLFRQDCNAIVTAYFALLGLACFATAGLSFEKLTNFSIAAS